MIAKIYELFTKIGIPQKGHDKVLHAVCGFIIGFTVHIFTIGTMWAFIAILVAGAGKEAYDVIYKGHIVDEIPLYIAYKERFDFFDLFYTLLAGYIGIFLAGAIGA